MESSNLKRLLNFVGSAGGNQSESAAAEAALRADQVPGQDLQCLAHCHPPAGVPCRPLPPCKCFTCTAPLCCLPPWCSSILSSFPLQRFKSCTAQICSHPPTGVTCCPLQPCKGLRALHNYVIICCCIKLAKVRCVSEKRPSGQSLFVQLLYPLEVKRVMYNVFACCKPP